MSTARLAVTVRITVLIIVLVVHCQSVTLQYLDTCVSSFLCGTCCQRLVVIVACSFFLFLHRQLHKARVF